MQVIVSDVASMFPPSKVIFKVSAVFPKKIENNFMVKVSGSFDVSLARVWAIKEF